MSLLRQYIHLAEAQAKTRALKQLEQNGGVNTLAGQPKPVSGVEPGKSFPGQIGLD